MKFLTSGCSFSGRGNGAQAGWSIPLLNFGDVVNLACPGAGNLYIADGVINHLLVNPDYDYVVVMWSGLQRFDLAVDPASSPVNYLQEFSVLQQSENIKYDIYAAMTDGLGHPPFKKQYFMMQDEISLSYQSLMSMIKLQNHLNQLKIPYFFSSYVNYFNAENELPDLNFGLYKYPELKKYLDYLEMDRWIFDEQNRSIYEYSRDTGNLGEDGFHPNVDAIMHWGQLVKDRIRKDL